MYIPPYFVLSDTRKIGEIMRSSSFATLIASSGGSPIAAHLPVEIVEGGDGSGGTVVAGHMARANPLWQAALAAREVLAIFLGPHTYVSPTWYEEPAVPTWNYSAVHLYGSFRLIEGRDALYGLLRRLVARNESWNGSPVPFDLQELPTERVDGMMKGIVGFEIIAERIEAVAKLSQNHSQADRRSIIAHLANRSDDASHGVADAMVRFEGKRTGGE